MSPLVVFEHDQGQRSIIDVNHVAAIAGMPPDERDEMWTATIILVGGYSMFLSAPGKEWRALRTVWEEHS